MDGGPVIAGSVTSRLSAFWLAWKWVLLLALALAASLYGNYRQHIAAVTAPLRADLDAARDGLVLSGVLQADARAAGDQLRADVAAARATLSTAGRNYRNAVARAPLGVACAPGAERMDAVNTMLGESPERTTSNRRSP
ncbi:hypothetical protein V3391_06575 [Luteimonas sp. SMYT11W]|uniref:DUF2570 domain-containing protein n=1 Tax=Luteimonas flava TaxID=3115822 RepID=A0ABU7WDR5_9GAMM